MAEIFVDIVDVATRPVDVIAAVSFVAKPGNGATSLFVGTVREFNQGKTVLGVSYDVFTPLAKRAFAAICAEARDKWGEELSCYVVHGKGRLPVGGVSVVIAVGAAHRDEACKACRYVIEQIKHRAPIWKLEHYRDGDSRWTQGCQLCTHEYEVGEDHHHG